MGESNIDDVAKGINDAQRVDFYQRHIKALYRAFRLVLFFLSIRKFFIITKGFGLNSKNIGPFGLGAHFTPHWAYISMLDILIEAKSIDI